MQEAAQTHHFIKPCLMGFAEYEKHALQLSELLMLICCQLVDLQPTRRILSHHEARMAGSLDKAVSGAMAATRATRAGHATRSCPKYCARAKRMGSWFQTSAGRSFRNSEPRRPRVDLATPLFPTLPHRLSVKKCDKASSAAAEIVHFFSRPAENNVS